MIELDQKIVKAKEMEKSKVQGMTHAGVSVSLTEANQNGISAVDNGIAKAAKFGQSLFPLNFNARTPSGEESIVFSDQASWDQFCLQFMAARQQYFN